MLGLIVSGRLVQTNFAQVGETQFLVDIEDADNINHVVLFLTGQVQLPATTIGSIYFSWPDPNSPPNWQYLGFISNSKPSAVFKISQLKRLHEMEQAQTSIFGTLEISHTAQIGISIEPEFNALQNTPATTSVVTYFEFGKKLLENFVNFASSYTVSQSQMVPNPSETFVPISVLTQWFTNFQRRLEQNPNFWKTL